MLDLLADLDILIHRTSTVLYWCGCFCQAVEPVWWYSSHRPVPTVSEERTKQWTSEGLMGSNLQTWDCLAFVDMCTDWLSATFYGGLVGECWLCVSGFDDETNRWRVWHKVGVIPHLCIMRTIEAFVWRGWDADGLELVQVSFSSVVVSIDHFVSPCLLLKGV